LNAITVIYSIPQFLINSYSKNLIDLIYFTEYCCAYECCITSNTRLSV